MTHLDLDPATPIIVGAGQTSERLSDPGYRRLSAVELAAEAARAAIADSGADSAAIAAAISVVAGVRQFENSTPAARAALGRSDNYPRSVAGRIGAEPARAILDVAGGQAPQHLVNELCARVAAGEVDVALIVGSEAISTVRRFADADNRPDFTEHAEGTLEDRGYGLRGLLSRQLAAHGLVNAASRYALCENARRGRLGQSREQYALGMGELFAPFTAVAASNRHAAARTVRSVADLVTPTERNRLIADPYPRYLVAREKVNQGAAVLLMSIAAARRLGVPRDRWVFLPGHADLRDQPILHRGDLSRGPASVLAVRHALDLAGIGVADLATIDLYSCFPIAVSNICDDLGLRPDDPRGLTVTGGLPFFGGPGNNYSMHAIAATIDRAREHPGSFGLVGANGGTLDKYSVGVYSTTPSPWRGDHSGQLQSEIDRWPTIRLAPHADGWATVETHTVVHGPDGARTGAVIGRLEVDGRRFVATADPRDSTTMDMVTAGEPVGARVFVRSSDNGNRFATSVSTMDRLLPTRPERLREDYDHVLVRRDGHILEIIINRPEKRNSLHPPANAELDEVFTNYFADDDLWVAIVTGAGDAAFCAGNDLAWQASGKSVPTPRNGFAGLTRRRALPKPVVAAVNGFAFGGGLELALACHLVVADETAQFALSEVRVGLVAGAGGLVRLPRAVPPKVANEMILTGRPITAAQALTHGLVNRVVASGAALAGARELAAEILASSPKSVRASIQIMTEAQRIADPVDAMDAIAWVVDDLLGTDDAIEGVAAFVEKRRPQWKNR